MRDVPSGETDSRGLAPWDEGTRTVGRALPRIDAYERVSGSAVYTLDLALPGMLHAAVVRCPHAHARVTRVDTGRAEAMPGVHVAITGASAGADIPWYSGPQGPTSRIFDPHCRYEGEEVAAVAAETPEQAHDAARAVLVEYEALPVVLDPAAALAPEAPALHPGGNRARSDAVYARGDVAAGFAAAEVVLEQTYHTATELHVPLEVHCSVARWDGDRLTIWDSTQGVFDVQSALARAFGLPAASVRVIGHYMGGGFGSKLEPSKHTVIAALLTRRSGRPVKLALTREESLRCVGNRPANTLALKVGAKADGTLTALSLRTVGTCGAYPASVGSSFLVGELYRCPNVRTEEVAAFVNAGKERPFRAPGYPQCAWALEQMMDALAEALHMDPVELRLRNVPEASQMRPGVAYTSSGLRRCLEEGAAAFGWKGARRLHRDRGAVRRGAGVAAGMWGYPGQPSATAIVKLFADGSVNLNTGCSDIGTGTKTVMAMVASEELGVSLDRIQIEHADTATTQYAPASGGSQTVLVNAPAVRAAAAEVKAELLALAAEELGRPAEALLLRDGAVEMPGRRVPFAELKSLSRRRVLVGVGRRGPHPPGKVALPFAAQFAEVEVSVRTGEVRVLRMLAAHDSGRVMNPLTYRNQVFGGITMGLGFGLTERRILDRQTGKLVTGSGCDYRVPTAMDVVPEPMCLPIDLHDTECNSVGAKGLGEPATIPTAAAVANAVYDAIGVRMNDAPMTPMQVLERLSTGGRGR